MPRDHPHDQQKRDDKKVAKQIKRVIELLDKLIDRFDVTLVRYVRRQFQSLLEKYERVI